MYSLKFIDFYLNGKVGGVDLSPRTISLSRFNEFNRQVEAFLAGSQRELLNETHVEVGDGSYRLRVILVTAVALAVEADLIALAREDSLGELDPKRAEVVAKWQDLAHGNDGLEVGIRPDRKDLPTVRLTGRTNFRIGEVIPWVTVEKYLFGMIENMGGVQKANVHLRLRDTGQTVIVNTSQDRLRDQPENRLYRETLLRVRAEQHFKTGQLRNIHLVSFEDYAPSFNEDEFNRFTSEGVLAWRDVPDATEWVRRQRGGN